MKNARGGGGHLVETADTGRHTGTLCWVGGTTQARRGVTWHTSGGQLTAGKRVVVACIPEVPVTHSNIFPCTFPTFPNVPTDNVISESNDNFMNAHNPSVTNL